VSELHSRSVDERDLDTVLSEDIVFNGELEFVDPLMIKGHFRGEIRAQGDLYIGESALVEAKVKARVIDLLGTVRGNLTADERIELRPSSRIDGDLTAPVIVMNAGSRFNGICTMPEKAKQENPQ